MGFCAFAKKGEDAALNPPKKLFYGWVVVLSSVAMMALGVGMFTSTNSVYVKPVCESLGFSRGEFTLHRTLITLIGASIMPLYGRFIARYGARKVMSLGALMLGLVSIGYSFSTKLWHFYALALINGAFVNGISFMTIGVLISNWFNCKKGLALGLAYSGSGLGGAVMVPVVSHIIETSGWEWAYRAMGILGIAVLLPVIALLVRNKPEDIGLSPMAPDHQGLDVSANAINNLMFRETLRTKKFWLFITAVFLFNFCAGSTNTHSAPYLSDLGYPGGFVSSVISLFMIFLTVGKIILGYVYDRKGAFWGNLVVSVFTLAFPVFALLAHLPGMPWVYAVCIGMSSCGVSVPTSILVVRYFGDRDFATIFSFCSMISAFGPALSVPAMGAIFDATGSYRPAWAAFTVICVLLTGALMGAEILHRREERGGMVAPCDRRPFVGN